MATLLTTAATAVAYEQPAYELLGEFPDFEVRRYEPFLVAETQVDGAFGDAGNRAFRILAGFIGGDNRRGEEMAMTAPVFHASDDASAERASAPSLELGAESDEYVYGFVMPSRYSGESLPAPDDPRVRIREVPARVMAVRRFSGIWRQERFERNEAVLLQAVADAGLESVGAPIGARYNSPFTPWFLRRNEVMVELAAFPAP